MMLFLSTYIFKQILYCSLPMKGFCYGHRGRFIVPIIFKKRMIEEIRLVNLFGQCTWLHVPQSSYHPCYKQCVNQ